MPTKNNYIHHISKRPAKKVIFMGVAVFLCLGVILALLEWQDVTHLFHETQSKTAVTASQSTKGEPANDTSNSSAAKAATAQNDSAAPGDNKSTTDGTTTKLITPTGNFVSAHKQVPASASLTSVCNTSSGALCTISFTSGSVTKSLPAQIADRGGSVYWNSWTPSSIGLYTGVWHIKATATLGNQTESSSDALNLEVTE